MVAAAISVSIIDYISYHSPIEFHLKLDLLMLRYDGDALMTFIEANLTVEFLGYSRFLATCSRVLSHYPINQVRNREE